MKMSKMIRVPTALFMALMLTNIPAIAASEIQLNSKVAHTMLSTSDVVADLNRSQEEDNIKLYLEKPEVQAELIKRGVAPTEVTARLASLSDSELRQLSLQVGQAHYGGDILFTILIVVLIIFLIKKM
jgi:hypothetical protein